MLWVEKKSNEVIKDEIQRTDLKWEVAGILVLANRRRFLVFSKKCGKYWDILETSLYDYLYFNGP